MSPVDYDFERNQHTLAGPRAALPVLLAGERVQSLLDVGCGPGTWLKVATELGVTDILGIDGLDIPPASLLIPPRAFRRQDLTASWNLGRRFDAALCLEVAEHLEPRHAESLIAALVQHADLVIFSAAAPGQSGQHHVNCQPPDYWQRLFNAHGYVCLDAARWQLWSDSRIEPWYRQNLFVARKDRARAGVEPRIPLVVHPELLALYLTATVAQTHAATLREVEAGTRQSSWYLRAAARALLGKVQRNFAAKK